MKKILLVLIMVLAFTLPVMANSITFEVETNDFGTFTDSEELYLEYKISDDMTAGITVATNDLIFGAPTVTVDGTLDFVFGGGTAQIGAGVDVTANTYYVKGKILNYGISDDLKFNAKAKYNLPSGTYWAVANVVYTKDRFEIIAEARTDSDGFVPYSAGLQLSYAITENADIIVGIEWNGWDDAINDWDAMSISSDSETYYGKLVVRF